MGQTLFSDQKGHDTKEATRVSLAVSVSSGEAQVRELEW